MGAEIGDFDDLVRRYRRELHVYCYRMLGSFDEAEDHVQEVLLRAWRSREGFQGQSSVRTWLYRVAANACLDTLRRDARRVHKVARETVTLDLLSSGRLVLGVELGSTRHGELEQFGEVTDARERARLLDDGLDALARYWAGEFEPVPVQRPRPPVWVAGVWPNRPPVRRALRWDGLFPIDLPGPGALGELAAEVREARPDGGLFDLITELPPGTDLEPWEQAGLTWAVTYFEPQPTEAEVRAVIDAGPGATSRR